MKTLERRRAFLRKPSQEGQVSAICWEAGAAAVFPGLATEYATGARPFGIGQGLASSFLAPSPARAASAVLDRAEKRHDGLNGLNRHRVSLPSLIAQRFPKHS